MSLPGSKARYKTAVTSEPSEPAPAFLPFSRPSLTLGDIDAVIQVLKSGWITSGASVEALEADFRAITRCQHAIALSSATAGMHLALHALGIGPGDEVISPSMTWVSTLNLIALSGATPVFADVDRDTLMTNAGYIEEKITPATRLIIPVHYAGAPLDLNPIRDLARQRGIALLEDAAHALGTIYRGTPVGNCGTSIFSLQAIKNVTSAEGGVVCTDDDALARKLRRLRFHGLEADAFDRESRGRSPQAEVVEPGFKYNLPDMNASLALGQLERLQNIIRKRETLAHRYLERLRGNEAVTPIRMPGYPMQHSWHLFVVRVETDRLGLTREEFMAALKHRNIGSGIHFKAVHQQPYYQNMTSNMASNKASVSGSELQHTEWNSARIVSLPLFADMTLGDVDRVVGAIEEIEAEAHR